MSLRWTPIVLVFAGVLAACATRPPVPREISGFAVGSSGGFSAQLFLVDEPERFIDAVRAPGDPVRINTVNVAYRGQMITAFVAVAGCAGNVAGACDVQADFAVRDATGKLVANKEEVPLWREPPTPAPGKILFGEVSMTVKVAPDAPTGTWDIRAVIRDRVANQSINLRVAFQVA